MVHRTPEQPGNYGKRFRVGKLIKLRALRLLLPPCPGGIVGLLLSVGEDRLLVAGLVLLFLTALLPLFAASG